MRIYELSKQLGVSNKDILDLLPSLGVVVKNHASSLTPDDVQKVVRVLKPEMIQAAKAAASAPPAAKAARPAPAAPTPSATPVPAPAAAPSVPRPAAAPVASSPAAPVAPAPAPVVAPAVQPAAATAAPSAPAVPAAPVRPAAPVAAATYLRVPAMPQPKIIQEAPPGPPPSSAKPRPTAAERFRNAGPRQPQRRKRRTRDPLPPPPKPTAPVVPTEPEQPIIVIREGITVKELAEKTKRPAAELIRSLMKLNIMTTLNQRIPLDSIELLGMELGFKVQREELFKASELHDASVEDDGAEQKPRPPVVTIMGHVDHGKTLLLDYIRKARVVEGEAGGITQHVGAYTVETSGGRITFIDTPGHEAFTAMRARGASVTDIVILVVAANDGVMPQTEEAIHHAQAAGVPIIVAINKIDLPNLNVERVKQQLGEHNLVPEEWGGKTIMVPVSAKSGLGVDKLLEMILLQAEIMELKASTDAKRARGIVLEARLDKSQGAVATVLVQSGTLNIGDTFVCGTASARVRALIDSDGRRIESAGPSTPVLVVGFSDVPQVGDSLLETENERDARAIAEERARIKKEESLQKSVRVSLEDLKAADGDTKELSLVVKADAQGSIQAIRDVVERLSTSQVRLKVIHGAVGAINDNDVNLAAASNALIVGFSVRSIGQAEAAAKRLGVEIRYYEIIYKLVEDVESAMKGLLAPKRVETVTGHAEVREIFKVPKVGSVAGCYVRDGAIKRTAEVRLLRDGKIVFTGKIGSLRRFKDDVKEVTVNYECGIGIENFNDVKVGDIIEAFLVTEEEAQLIPASS